jgi:signal transduction histidine kinase
MEPLWIGKALLLARRVRLGQKDYIQGCRLNWEYTRTWLLAGAGDLLGQADLKPVAAADAARAEPNMLATLPVKLLPGEVPDDIVGDTPTGPWAWPVNLSLLIAWACVLVGAGAVAVVLHGVVRLSERRGAFVSAVTHELRTPLTTFRLYTDMLAQGMVTDEDQRAKYIRRLNEEAQRLGHLVENVLAYARLSERSGGQAETVTLGDIVARSRDRLAARAEQAEMTLSVQDDTGSAEMLVGANVAAVDQILLNLVDNACKYAARADDRTIHLELGREGNFGTIRVRDHGPGIAKPVTKRLFRPFSKSAQEAARSAAGVGLGLSLSRRLARDFAGDLRLVAHGEGACFELALPAASV